MLQDDRVMSILTGLVIVVAMATLAQRSDSLLDFVMRDETPKITPQNDEAVMFAGETQVIDVLRNDENALPEHGEDIRIVVSPSCGAAEATSTGVLYISNERCVGPQLFAYCVQQGDECPSASVTVNVAAAAPGALRLAGNASQSQPQTPRQPSIYGSGAEATITTAPTTTGQTAPSTRASTQAARIGDSAAAPRISAAPQVGSAPAQAPVIAAPAPRIEPNTVVAAVRPTAPVQQPIGRLAAAPRIDDGGDAPPPPRPTLSVLSDDSEPRVSLNPIARPRFNETALGGEAVAAGRVEQPGDVRAAALPAPTSATEADRGERPDVSAIENQPAAADPNITEVARLQDPNAVDTGASIQNDAVQSIRQGGATTAPTTATTATTTTTAAVQPAEDIATDEPRPVAQGCGPIGVRTIAGAGASSIVTVSSRCRAGAPFALEHVGLSFSGRLDNDGQGEIVIPVMSEDGAAAVTFLDGSAQPVTLKYNWRELELTLRVAVAWTAPVDLNLHAFEYAAPFGGDGHVWQERPGGFRLVRRSGGGYLANFPAVADGGQSVEVYTFWANSRARRGVARIALDHASRGDLPAGAYCDDGALASPDYQVVRSERGEVKSTSRGRFTAAQCGAALTTEARYASGALRDLRID